tara:strand:+ start:668 stop:1189 length:522 start_codon:yes stop_codon:yes gene_type:complete
MFRNLLFIIFFFLLVISNSLAQEKVVFIDINFIFKNSNVGKELNEQIRKKDDQINLEINKFKNDIEVKKNEIISQKNVISVQEYNKKIENLETKIKEMNNLIAKKKNELNKFKNKVEASFSKELNSIIEIYSTENSIDMIFDKSNLLMARKDLNITQKIINLFNENVKEINIK